MRKEKRPDTNNERKDFWWSSVFEGEEPRSIETCAHDGHVKNFTTLDRRQMAKNLAIMRQHEPEALSEWQTKKRTEREVKEQEEKLDWIGYDDAHASLPQARWTEALRRNSSQKLSPVRITDIETALQATINGAGKSLLPVEACKGNSHLRKTREQSDNIELKRDVWLLSHIDQEAHSSISTVKSWLKEISWK